MLHLKGLLDTKTSNNYYQTLLSLVDWKTPSHYGIKSRHGNTRSMYKIDNSSHSSSIILDVMNQLLDQVSLPIMKALAQSFPDKHFMYIGDCFLNYYCDGNHYTPLHNHENQYQIILSLGASRKFLIEEINDVKNLYKINTTTQCTFVPKQGPNQNKRCMKATWKNDFCANHFYSEIKCRQTEHVLDSSDVIIFGSNYHSLLKEPEVKEGRISIALFIDLR